MEEEKEGDIGISDESKDNWIRLIDPDTNDNWDDNSLENAKEEKNSTLSKEDIDKAYKIIENRYPLRFIPVCSVLNMKYLWCWCIRKKQRDRDFESDKVHSLVMCKAFESINQSQSMNSNENLQKK